MVNRFAMFAQGVDSDSNVGTAKMVWVPFSLIEFPDFERLRSKRF